MNKMKNKNRAKRYTHSLKSAPTIEPNEYYKSDTHKRLSYVDAVDVKIDGITYGKTIETLDSKIQLVTELQNEIKGCSQALTSFLIEYGYNTPNIELNPLINDLSNLNIIHPNKKYMGFKLDGDYVKSLGYDVLLEVIEDLPDDLYNGYWMFIDGELKLDEEKFKQMWSAL
ncbi:MAG: hypothetical protein GQ557_02205 [Mycoplasmataceae bacterium]|nr:hypothetical protein [Mycoplasmataceae bacterium]